MALGGCNRTHYWEDAVGMCVPCFSSCEPLTIIACTDFCQEFLSATTIATGTENESWNLLHILWIFVPLVGLVLLGIVGFRIRYLRRSKRKQNRPQGAWTFHVPEPGQEETQLMDESCSLASSVFGDSLSTLNLSRLGPGPVPRCRDEFCERDLLVGSGNVSCGLSESSSPADVLLSVHSNSAWDRCTGKEGTPEHPRSNRVPFVSQPSTNQPATSQPPTNETIPTFPSNNSGSSLLDGVPRWPPIADKVYDYLDSQQWVKLVLSSGGHLDIYVTMDMSLGEAQRRILDQNELNLDARQLKVYNLVGNPVVRKLHGTGSIVAGQQVYFGDGRSTISYFLYCRSSKRLLMVTTAHGSTEGIGYFADPKKSEYIGTCIAAFEDSTCDVAFIEVEIDSPFYKKTCNFLPTGKIHQMSVPSLSKLSVEELAEAGTPIMRHGRPPIAYGQFAMIRVRNRDEPAVVDKFYVLKPDGNEADFSQPGDSGSPITSRATDNDDTQLRVKLYGHLVGDYDYRGTDGQEVSQTVGIISCLQVGMERLNQKEGQNNEYTLMLPECKFHKIIVTSRGSSIDTGYHSATSPTNPLTPTGSTFFLPN